MKRATFTVLLYIKRPKKLKDGTSPIYARITVNSQRAEFALHKTIYEIDWKNEKGCVRWLFKYSKDVEFIT